MSCNGCRALRKGCSQSCILRPCLDWIESPQAQSNATLFVSKFFGRSDLMAFIGAVPENNRPALFQSLLFEACGRTVNPVNGALGLLSTGNWHLCQVAVKTVLSGGTLRPIGAGTDTPAHTKAFHSFQNWYDNSTCRESDPEKSAVTISIDSEESGVFISFDSSDYNLKDVCGEEPKLLNLFV